MEAKYMEVFHSYPKFNEIFLQNGLQIIKVRYLKKSNKLKLMLRCKGTVDGSLKEAIKSMVAQIFKFSIDIDVVFYQEIPGINPETIITGAYWSILVDYIAEYVPACRECLMNSKRATDNQTVKISTGNKFMFSFLKSRNIEVLLKNSITDLFNFKCGVDFKYEPDIGNANEPIVFELPVLNTAIKHLESESNEESLEKVILGKMIKDKSISISNIQEVAKNIVISGKVFRKEIKNTKKGSKFLILYITDYTSSITVKVFPKQKDEEKVINSINEGCFYKIRGEVTDDSYENELVMIARDIQVEIKNEKNDTSDEKRVELHLHTNMSAMDGITAAKDLITTAAKWGHKAIAITDHGVVQAYPEAMEASKKHNIKVIYGIEAYLVDDGHSVVTKPENKSYEDEFVVFDIETTGFSSTNDKIIEIGAVRIENGKITDTFSEFVNPNRTLPNRIVELTGIKDEMLKDAEEIDAVLKKFMDFAGDSILVAHNSDFDMSFIRKNCRDIGIACNNGVLDTLALSKLALPELSKYKLDTIAKHLKINMGNHHRAIDDANTAAKIMLSCFERLKAKNICDLKSINEEYKKSIDYKKLNTNHVILLCANQTGLKNLYKLVSYSNLDYFYKKPRMPKSLIENLREGLIIGSACESGEIFRAVLSGKTNDELAELVGFYDYLEIQPEANNYFLIKKGEVSGPEELRKINKKICDLGEKYNLPVVATCDVHFLNPEDEVYRKILMYGQKYSDAEEQPPLFMRTTEEMLEEFSYLGIEKAREVVIHNTNKIANMIGEVKPIPDETFAPKIDGAEEEIKEMVMNKVHEIYGHDYPEIIEKRLNKELNSIINNGYAVLYLIAQKLVAKSYEDGYLVGSRGSVGSSFVATMAGITEVNGLPPHYICKKCKNSEFVLDGSVSSGVDLPDKICPFCGELYHKDGHDIPFETFLGFEGDKEPDIDLNFSGEYQSVVHRYTEVLFGKGHVFKAGTIGTVAEKTAYGFVKKYMEEKGVKYTKAEIERLSKGCTGVKRTTGQHPGGIMVVPSDNEIFNFTPIQHPADDSGTDIITTHFDYHSLSGRLLKLDILGHDDPTMLKMLQDLTGVDPKTLPLSDEKVLSLFTSTDALGVTSEEINCDVGTLGLPEFGTKFVRQMLVETKPATFSDLVRISGLSHGTDVWINNAQYYIKEGYTTLSECISTRDDIMTYLIHKGLHPKTAFSIMEKVRKGKGVSEEYEKIMLEHNVPKWYIESCRKIKYMFPKGHAVAYVMMAVRIAYFKVYYPKEYYAAYFTVRADDFDAEILIQDADMLSKKLNELNALGNNATQKDKGLITLLEITIEMLKRNIKFLRVDLYKSDAIKFLIEEDGIRLPINSLQGVGINAAKSIVKAREKGKFLSKEDLRIRAKISKTVIETLEKHLCLDMLPESNQISLFNL